MSRALPANLKTLGLSLALIPSAYSVAEPSRIQIEGDSAIFDQASKTVTYAGSVTATQGDLVIEGERLIVALVADEVDTIRTTGSPAKFSMPQLSEDTNVAQRGKLQASALTILFAPASNQLQLLGNAVLQQGSNVIRSDEIIYNVNAKEISAKGDSKRVRMEFELADQAPGEKIGAPERP